MSRLALSQLMGSAHFGRKVCVLFFVPSRLASGFSGGLIQQHPQLFGAAHTGGFETGGKR
jgi:hypothetical protein